MTTKLNQAFDKLRRLPQERQDEWAKLISETEHGVPTSYTTEQLVAIDEGMADAKSMKLAQIIESSEETIRWLDRQIDGLSVPSDPRYRIAGGCLDLTTEYHKAIVMLVAGRLYGPAFGLMRLMFESCIRGIWIHKCAEEEDIEKFAKDNDLNINLLIKDIEMLEGYEDKMFSKLKKKYSKAMNSYTHTGCLQVGRRQTETTIESNFDDDEILEVVNFANSFGYLSAIATCELGGNEELAHTILERFNSK